MFEQKWLEPKWVCCLVLCCVVCCLVCCLVLCEVCCVRCGGVSVCSRFSWVRPRFARTNLNRTRPSAGPPKFSPLPPQFSFFLESTLRRVKPHRLWGRTRQPENSKRAHFRVPVTKGPQREKKERKLWREREKKREILGPHPSGSRM